MNSISVRQILMEGPLQLLDSGKAPEMFVILFDDMLLITRKKKGLSKKVKIDSCSIVDNYNNFTLVEQDPGHVSGKKETNYTENYMLFKTAFTSCAFAT